MTEMAVETLITVPSKCKAMLLSMRVYLIHCCRFRPGDVLGWFLRPVDVARYQPYLRRVVSDLSYYNSERRAVPTEFAIESNSVLPLLSVEICKYIKMY